MRPSKGGRVVLAPVEVSVPKLKPRAWNFSEQSLDVDQAMGQLVLAARPGQWGMMDDHQYRSALQARIPDDLAQRLSLPATHEAVRQSRDRRYARRCQTDHRRLLVQKPHERKTIIPPVLGQVALEQRTKIF